MAANVEIHRDKSWEMIRRTRWFWVAIAYLIATVSYNVWNHGTSIYSLPTDNIDVVANLGCKTLAIGFLIYRRGEGVYLLAAAFFIGLSGTISEFYQTGEWPYLSLLTKVSRINGYLISLAIILYMAALAKRGVLKIGRNSRLGH